MAVRTRWLGESALGASGRREWLEWLDWDGSNYEGSDCEQFGL
jgi:hypothetical protein